MASAASPGDGGGDDKPLESASASLDPPADPQRNGEPPAPAPSSGDADMSAMGTTEIPDNPARPECGEKLVLPSRLARCRVCARRNMIRRGIDPGPQSADELAASPPASASPVPGTELADPPSAAAVLCATCEHRKKIHRDRLLRRSSEVPAPLPGPSQLPVFPIPPLKLQARRGKKRHLPVEQPLSVEEERGYRQCDVGKKLMRHKWAALCPDPAPGFATAGGRDLLEKMMLDVQKTLPPPQEAQKPSSSPAARVDVLHQKLAQMPKVLSNALIEACVLQVSTKLMRVLCPEVGSTAAAGGGLYGSDWGLVEKAIDDLVNQTGEGMQDIVKTVIPKVFSKEILYDLIMTCVGRFPKLLEDDKGKLTQEKHKQYQKQLDLMVNLTMVYDDDPENFSKIMKFLCKIGECGPLPSEVIDDISPGLDLSTMEQLYAGMLEQLLHNVGGAYPVHVNPISK